MKENNTQILIRYVKEAFIECFVVFSISFILYAIQESRNNIIVSLFDATQHRIYLDLKNLMIATYIYTFFNFWIKEKREKNLWSAISIKIIFQTIIYVIFLSIFRYEPLYKKYAILSVCIILAQIIEKLCLRYLKTSKKVDEILKYINVFLVILFIIFVIFG